MTKRILSFVLGAPVLLLLAGCESPEAAGRLDGAIKPNMIRAHLKMLSDDVMEGRAPGSRGGELAAKYIASQFEEAGLLPAVGDTSYFQSVELVGIKATPAMLVRGFGRFWRLIPGADFVAWSKIEQTDISLRNTDVVFVGYGIDAPEFNWNDYKSVDVSGKILLMLVNEPPSESQAFFGGPALTYYGRWTYKYEEAARRGAAGVILIHTTPLAGYGWNVIQNSRMRESFQIRPPEDTHLLSLRAWITEEKAREILGAGGLNLEELIVQAESPSFTPFEPGLRVTTVIRNEVRTIQSPNVIAKLPGRDPELRDQCLVYTAHYDHLGKNEDLTDDGIFNGAFDNASGTAVLIAIGSAFAQSQLKPKRTILFAAVTAEESGLLGSQYYAEHPLFPLGRTIANINIDAVNVWGKTKNIVPIGADLSTIGEVVNRVAQEMNLEVSPDPAPGQGMFFRSDQFSFVKKGVPAVFLKGGLKYVGKPDTWGEQLMLDYRRSRYHGVGDEFDPGWSLEGTSQIAQFALKVGFYLSRSENVPEWHTGVQFKRIRDRMSSR
ncbi:MAG: M20/M25/M40 family metallo-hydrolase [Calditrichaeota bacterium]|nr:M20/M25/M40 family metallo-hydrolase [Calditrichota bacterium]